MKKTLLALGLASLGFAALPAFAQDSAAPSGNYMPNQSVGSGNWFIGANVGRTNGTNEGGFGSDKSGFNFFKGDQDRRTGYGVLGGYRWKVGNDLGLGAELGYTDLGNYRVRNVFNSNDVNQSSHTNALRGWMAGVNGKLNLVPGWYISAHGGFFYANNNRQNFQQGADPSVGFTSDSRAHRGSWYGGIGTGWDINDHFSAGVSYDYFHANAGKLRNAVTGDTASDYKRSTGIVSLAGEYRF
ncbi:outer membrane protein [Pinirhizobacter sp.]|jgi:OOP family OmpA-OmpF porin/outer membrane immunogenic protein|uniref:outer membrane protein n=1 Tax=Pinirhizobacter sp. TaxID=2950432 RepID=UPI002F41E994